MPNFSLLLCGLEVAQIYLSRWGGWVGWCQNDIKAIPIQFDQYWPTGTELGNKLLRLKESLREKFKEKKSEKKVNNKIKVKNK